MKKFVPQKIASWKNTKKTYFRNLNTKIKTQNSHEPSANPQRIKTQKSGPVIFKDVKTGETLSSQDHKLVKTANLWR